MSMIMSQVHIWVGSQPPIQAVICQTQLFWQDCANFIEPREQWKHIELPWVRVLQELSRKSLQMLLFNSYQKPLGCRPQMQSKTVAWGEGFIQEPDLDNLAL